MEEPQSFDVNIETLVYGGDAMGRLPDGRAVFVACALPGERVRLRLTEQKRNFARGVLLEVLTPAPDRIEPGCGNLDECGGCHYKYMTYAAQLRYKTAILRDQFQRIAGISDPPVEDAIPSPDEWHYRNTVQFHLTPDGKPGFLAPNSHRVTPVHDCALCDPVISEMLPLLDFSDPEGGVSQGLARIQLRSGADGDLMMVIELNNPVPPEFSVEMPINAVFIGPGGFEENAPLVLSGDAYLVMEAMQRLFRVSAGSFFQVNTAQAENMLRYLLEALPLKAETQLLEVYAGVGLFSAFLAPRVGRLVAVESAPSAVEDFAVNLDEFEHVELYDGLAEEVLPALEIKPDVVLVDPPRAGLALPALDALIDMQAPFLAYVSCDPATLARDAKRLLAAGYQLTRVQPFDMFPQTYHIESISFFER